MLIENELKKQKKDFGLVLSANVMFDGGDGFQAYLIFQPIYRYFKMIINTKYISKSKSKGISDESIKPSTISDNSLAPLIDYYDYKIKPKFKLCTLLKKQ